MSLFDRRAPAVPPQPHRFRCEHCPWFSYDAEHTFGHLMTAHLNRRVVQTLEHPARRSTDLSPALRRFREAAARGEGLHRGRRGLS